MLIMRLLGAPSWGPTPFDGQYLVEYDPTREGVDPDGTPMLAHIVTTDDPGRARRFADLPTLHACWTLESGQPYPRNRPLTGYNIEPVTVDDDRTPLEGSPR